jgi:hypothetical protein
MAVGAIAFVAVRDGFKPILLRLIIIIIMTTTHRSSVLVYCTLMRMAYHRVTE